MTVSAFVLELLATNDNGHPTYKDPILSATAYLRRWSDPRKISLNLDVSNLSLTSPEYRHDFVHLPFTLAILQAKQIKRDFYII